MILVDTSVLIDYFKGKKTVHTAMMDVIINEQRAFGITSEILLELLQGTNSLKEFKLLKTYLETLTIYELLDPINSYAEAAMIYKSARKKGITIRSTIDCIIAQTCIENKLTLFHNDKDFDEIKKVHSSLKMLNPNHFL